MKNVFPILLKHRALFFALPRTDSRVSLSTEVNARFAQSCHQRFNRRFLLCGTSILRSGKARDQPLDRLDNPSDGRWIHWRYSKPAVRK